MSKFIQKWNLHSKDPKVRKTYKAWNNMHTRCYDPKHKSYPNYGGRGVRVCERWLNNFDNFVVDMGLAPPHTSLDRYDTEGMYDPFNCRWATIKEQANNTRQNVYVIFQGRKMTATQLAEKFNMPPSRLLMRLRRGWPLDRALGYKI